MENIGVKKKIRRKEKLDDFRTKGARAGRRSDRNSTWIV